MEPHTRRGRMARRRRCSSGSGQSPAGASFDSPHPAPPLFRSITPGMRSRWKEAYLKCDLRVYNAQLGRRRCRLRFLQRLQASSFKIARLPSRCSALEPRGRWLHVPVEALVCVAAPAQHVVKDVQQHRELREDNETPPKHSKEYEILLKRHQNAQNTRETR